MYGHPKMKKTGPYGVPKPKKKRGRPTLKQIQARKQADLFLAEKIKAECRQPESLSDDRIVRNYLKAVALTNHV